jgi:hypothetical protein
VILINRRNTECAEAMDYTEENGNPKKRPDWRCISQLCVGLTCEVYRIMKA